jgi:hypothetical protein
MPSQWTWAPDPKKVKMPIQLKIKTDFELTEFIEDVLRKKYIKRPPKDLEENYIVDLYTKRQSRYFYLCAKYHSRAKNRMFDYYEIRFARLEYTTAGFNLAYMRHTGKWWPLYTDLSLKETLKIIATNGNFEP